MSEVDPTVPLCTEPILNAVFYGPGGGGKTTLLAQATRYWNKKGYKSRVIGTDGGSFDPYESGIAKGYIEYMSADAWTAFAPNVLFKLLAEGHWPEDVKTPNSRLVPGYVELRLCPSCGKDSGSKGAASVAECLSCKAPLPKGVRLPITRRLTHLAGIGCIIFEGVSKIGDMFLHACKESRPGDKFFTGGSLESQAFAQKANEVLKKKAESWTQEDAKVLAAANEACERHELFLEKSLAMDHYGKAQGNVQAMIAASKKLPVPHVLWSALEGREEKPINPANPNGPTQLLGLGPKGPGSGLTRAMVPWFSMVGHIVKVGDKRTLHLDAHKGEGTVSWQAKTNIVGMVKEIPLEDPTKTNNFEVLVGEMEKAKGKELP